MKDMKSTEDIQEKLDMLYALQNEQEQKLTKGISQLSTVFTPVHLISELIGSVVQKAAPQSDKEPVLYSPLWDKLTDQVGITSPLAKTTIHLALDQLMSKWLDNQKPVLNQDKPISKEVILVPSVNHF
jgi:hypothetical protein